MLAGGGCSLHGAGSGRYCLADVPERAGGLDHEVTHWARWTAGESIQHGSFGYDVTTTESRAGVPVRGLDRGRGARGAELRVLAGRAGVHRTGPAGSRAAVADRSGPGGRAAGVPAGRRVLLQDRGAAGHRPRPDRAEQYRAGLPPRVLPAGPGRVRVPQRPGPHPPAHRSTPRRRPRPPLSRTGSQPASTRAVRRRDRLDRGGGAGPAAGRYRAVRGEQAGRPVRGDRGAGRGHRAAGGAGRAGDRSAVAALRRARLPQRARPGDRDPVRDRDPGRGARRPGRGRHVQRVVGVRPDAPVPGPSGEPPVLQERGLRGGLPRRARRNPGPAAGVLLLAAGPDRAVGRTGVRGARPVSRILPQLQQGFLCRTGQKARPLVW